MFIAINWILCLVTSAILLLLLFRYKFLFIKPSILVITFFHIMIQWAATLNSEYIESYLPHPSEFAILVHGFPLIGVFISFFTLTKDAKKVWHRLIYPQHNSLKIKIKAAKILLIIVAFITSFYLSYISWKSTGLFAIINDPLTAAQAREESLKLVDNWFIRYSYSFLRSSFVPLLSVLLASILVHYYKKKKIRLSIITAFVILLLLLTVSLSGARGPAAQIMLTIILAGFYRRKFKINIFYLVFACLIVLSIPTLLSILREGKILQIALFWQYLRSSIFARVFYAPMITGLWHVHYAQTEHLFGIAAIPKLAPIFGVDPINVPNLIGLNYANYSLETVSANTCYLFSYYSYFGILSWGFSLLVLWLLDLSILIYKKIGEPFLLPCIASIGTTSLSFISSDYTVVLMTHGFVMILITSLFLYRACRLKIIWKT